jgi:hypothetical protein
MNTLIQKILREFREKFVDEVEYGQVIKYQGDLVVELEQFLSSALDEQRKLICEEVEKMKKEMTKIEPFGMTFSERQAHNNALNDVLSLLQKESEEEDENI